MIVGIRKVEFRMMKRKVKVLSLLDARLVMMISIFILTSCTGQKHKVKTEEIVFYSGPFKLVGDLRFPEREGPCPVVLFVHGDGPNSRTSGGTYLPIMERMAKAGCATFAWDKPGTGESTGEIDRSRLGVQRARIVFAAVDRLKAHPEIDTNRIGLWGISQAGYVMPRVSAMTGDIAFMIAVSCPGVAGVDQGAYLVSAQAACAGISKDVTDQMRHLLISIEKAEKYEEYVHYKTLLDALPGIGTASIFGFRKGIRSENDWHPPDLSGEYFWNPIEAIGQTSIPVLAIFGGKDTQIDPFQGADAYREALKRAGNSKSRVEVIPGTDHNIILSETGCLEERQKRPRKEWTNYAPQYLDILEEWLREQSH